EAPPSLAVVFDGIVLAPDGAPAAGAEVMSSAGGRAMTGLDGRYRLEVDVPLEAESVELTALAAGGGGGTVSVSVFPGAISGVTAVDPLVLAGDPCRPRWQPTFGWQPGVGFGGTVQALAVFDDGGGPALYLGGTFTTAGPVS